MIENQSGNKYYDMFISFRRCANAVALARDRELLAVGVTSGKAAIMHAIHHYGGKASPGEIANFLVLAPHTVVGTINRMEKEGLVSRRRGGPGVGRTTSVSLTEKGRAIWQGIWRDVRKGTNLIAKLFSSFSSDELERLNGYLDVMREIAFKKSLEIKIKTMSNASRL